MNRRRLSEAGVARNLFRLFRSAVRREIFVAMNLYSKLIARLLTEHLLLYFSCDLWVNYSFDFPQFGTTNSQSGRVEPHLTSLLRTAPDYRRP